MYDFIMGDTCENNVRFPYNYILKVISLRYPLNNINIDYISHIEIHNDKYGHGIVY